MHTSPISIGGRPSSCASLYWALSDAGGEPATPRGAPCGDDQAAPSATRPPECRGARLGYGWGSPLLSRANPSSLGPAAMLPLRPSAMIASSDRVRGDRPPSTVLMITGHASRVDSNRARILLDGISLSAYPIAPSMQISVFSPGLRARGLGKNSTRREVDLGNEELVVRIEFRTHVVRASWRAVRR